MVARFERICHETAVQHGYVFENIASLSGAMVGGSETARSCSSICGRASSYAAPRATSLLGAAIRSRRNKTAVNVSSGIDGLLRAVVDTLLIGRDGQAVGALLRE